MHACKGIISVCMIVAVFCLLPSDTVAGWSVVDIGTTDPLYGIWGSAFDDVFVVGANGTVLHYNGSEWTSMNSTVTNNLQNVWGSSSTDVFAVGNEGTVIHYDGSNWTSMTSNTTARLNAVWGSSSTDVFVVGNEGVIIHYDGSNWTSMESGSTTAWFSSVWGSSGNNVFVPAGRRVLHYDGSDWTAMETGLDDVQLRYIAGTSSTNVVAVGDTGAVDIAAVRYNGVNWSVVSSDLYCCISDLWSNSETDAFVVGTVYMSDPDSNSAHIYHYNGNTWSWTYLGQTCAFATRLYGVWGAGLDVFAVGEELNIEFPIPNVGKVLYLYNGICGITRLWPVDTSQSGTTVPLWAEVMAKQNLPENAEVWFWVDGPDWSGSHWVGSKSVAGLLHDQTKWYRFDWTIPSDAAAGTYTYKAQVWRGWTDEASRISDGQDFVVQAPQPPEAASLVSPNTSISTRSPAYVWNVADSSTWYLLWINDSSGTKVFSHWYRASEVTSGSTCSVTPPLTLTDGEYTWWIRTYNSVGYGPWSSGMKFTVDTASMPGTVTLISPGRTISDITPTYLWNADNLSTWYQIWVNDASSNTKVFSEWYRAYDVTSGSTCSATPSAELSYGSYKWWVRTYNSNGYGPWSDPMEFAVQQATIPIAPIPLGPSGAIDAGSVTFSWNDVGNADSYWIWLSKPTGTYDKTEFIANDICLNGTCSTTDLISLIGNYDWWVQGQNDAGTGPWSTRMDFSLQ